MRDALSHWTTRSAYPGQRHSLIVFSLRDARVSAGLDYICNVRDQLTYSESIAMVLQIRALALCLGAAGRWLYCSCSRAY